MAGKKKTQSRAKRTPKPAARKSAAKRSKAKAAPKGLQLHSGAPGLTVNDVGASMKFYCDVLGFIVKQKWEHEGVLLGGELAAGDVRIYIGQDDWKKGRDRVKGVGLRVYWQVKGKKDVDKFAAAIVKRGGTLASEPVDNEWGGRSFDLEDPTGYKITVSSPM
jgi:uncharacterized glyoxalase superfamily protein PhnB